MELDKIGDTAAILGRTLIKTAKGFAVANGGDYAQQVADAMGLTKTS